MNTIYMILILMAALYGYAWYASVQWEKRFWAKHTYKPLNKEVDKFLTSRTDRK